MDIREFLYNNAISADLSERAGISNSTISKIINGKQKHISYEDRQKLCVALSELSHKKINHRDLVKLLEGTYNE